MPSFARSSLHLCVGVGVYVGVSRHAAWLLLLLLQVHSC